MILCPACTRYEQCKEICPVIEKEITGRGKTASRKPKTYAVNFSHIEDTHQALNPFQRDVLRAIKDISSNVKQRLFTHLEIDEAISHLKDKEKDTVLLFMQDYKQVEIAQSLNISQPRINFLLQQAIGKIKRFLKKQL